MIYLFFIWHCTNTFRVQSTHVLGFVSTKGPDLNLMRQDDVWVFLKKHFIDSHIQRRDNLLWIADQLTIKVSVKRL